jgi:hypothetical protein
VSHQIIEVKNAKRDERRMKLSCGVDEKKRGEQVLLTGRLSFCFLQSAYGRGHGSRLDIPARLRCLVAMLLIVYMQRRWPITLLRFWGRALNVHMKRRNTAKSPTKLPVYRIFQLISYG